ncbi:MAG: DNA repair protein RadA [Candidatus Magasanikbacteria bacterium]|nr:DNA repair protein RadA [Candidatus Magasanikbacteria bacterium]
MPKSSVAYVCAKCDTQFAKWTGRCLECGAWGSVSETVVSAPSPAGNNLMTAAPVQPIALASLSTQTLPRRTTDIHEMDSVLGGGIVPGSLILLGGEPGIGKSTIALQLAKSIPGSPSGAGPGSLYFCGEESPSQIALRAKRLSADALQLVDTTHAESIIATIATHKPPLAIIDSIQTLHSDAVSGEAGGIAQMRACTTQLLTTAKQTNTAILIIGHVTKDGALAGPKTLEHLVDTVLYLEGDRFREYRLLRAVKNRFGSTDEIGIFTMTESGLAEVRNPGAAFIAERGDAVPGSVLTCLMEGTRPLLVEIQALLTKTTFGYPQRRASGFDLNRLQILIAILQKRSGLNLAPYDIHVNVVGGITADEPAADLGVCLAIASAYKDKTLSRELVAFGEVGLGGEVRPVRLMEKRVRECAQLGMRQIILPARTAPPGNPEGIAVIPVKNLEELILKA